MSPELVRPVVSIVTESLCCELASASLIRITKMSSDAPKSPETYILVAFWALTSKVLTSDDPFSTRFNALSESGSTISTAETSGREMSDVIPPRDRLAEPSASTATVISPLAVPLNMTLLSSPIWASKDKGATVSISIALTEFSLVLPAASVWRTKIASDP